MNAKQYPDQQDILRACTVLYNDKDSWCKKMKSAQPFDKASYGAYNAVYSHGLRAVISY